MSSLTVKQAQEFDKNAQETLGIPSLILMENAGRSVAEVAIKMLQGSRAKGQGRIVIVCGTGNNGGDGFVAARHLLNAGKKVKVFVVGDLAKIKKDPEVNLNILQNMGVKLKTGNQRLNVAVSQADLIIDAIFGIGLRSKVQGPMSNVIKTMNASHKPILAVDVPSGLDADSGKPLGNAVKAKATVTFVAAKKGFSKAKKYCGKILVRDIGLGIATRIV